MSHVTLSRSDLFSQTQTAQILGVDRHGVRALVRTLNIELKLDPTRSGKMLDRSGVERLAAALGKTVNWDAIAA